ncbi:MAG: aminotransferase class I/II-fold pyridoxal phosphate-dependent enzyme [Candidatus Gastranaerophilales bacterium]|nr:aminotransferase class I/II-fold pyridoxal phosphate-dependent enzyme [Candidatus Gastranaerophilales bacterium]
MTTGNKTIEIQPADKITKMPKYIFAQLADWKQEAIKNGVDVIDISIGNPDGATPDPVVRVAVEAIQNPANHGYPNFRGKPELRQAISSWMKRRYRVDIDPDTEVQTLIGEKEGLANIALAYTNPGDTNIIPDPYYPVLCRGTLLAGGTPYFVKLKEENRFLIDLSEIPDDVADKAKIFFINYPNNPTGAVAPKSFLSDVVSFCREHNILLVSDLAYGEVCFSNYRPYSIFNIDGAKDIAIEFHSFTKTFNMAGWRCGFAVGRKDFISNLYAMKSNMDYGTSTIVQDACIAALNMDIKYVKSIMDIYDARRETMAQGFTDLGFYAPRSDATMYFWIKIPSTFKNSMEFCRYVLDKTGVLLTPGSAFGALSDDHFRVSLVQPILRIQEVFRRFREAGIKYE